MDVQWAYIPPWNQHHPDPRIPVNNPIISDQVLQFEPWAEFMRQEVAAGRLPLWNPYVAGGVPFAANPQTALYYPLSSPLAVIVPDANPAFRAGLHAFLAAWFMALFLLRLGLSRLAAGFGGLVFAFSQFLSVWIGYPIGWAVAWFPAWLYFAERFSTEARASRTLFWAAGVIGLSALAGHPETTFHSAVFAMLYAALRSASVGGWRHMGRGPLRLGVAGVFGALLAAVMLVPFGEYLVHSSAYLARQSAHHAAFALPPDLALGAVFPWLFGAPAHDVLAANYNERAVYAGLVTLLLAGGIVFHRHAWQGPWPILIGLGIVGLLAGFDVGGLHRILGAVPGFSVIANHRLVFLATLALAALAALALARLPSLPGLRRWWIPALGLYGLALLLLMVPDNPLFPHLNEVIQRKGTHSFVTRAVLWAGALGVAALAAMVFLRRRPGLLVATLAGLGVAELVFFAWPINTVTPASWRTRSTPEIDALVARQPGRLIALEKHSALLPTTALRYRLRTLNSYEAIGVHRFDRLVGALKRLDENELHDPRLRLLGVTHLYAPEELASVPAGWTHEPLGKGHLYEVAGALPRAFISGSLEMRWNWDALEKELASPGFDPETRTVWADFETNFRYAGRQVGPDDRADIVVDDPGRVEIQATLSGPGMLVLTDAFFPGWKVTVDGAPGFALPVYGGVRGVPLTRGTRRVVFTYEPLSFRVGAAISLAALLVWVGGLVLMALVRTRARRGPGAEQTTAA